MPGLRGRGLVKADAAQLAGQRDQVHAGRGTGHRVLQAARRRVRAKRCRHRRRHSSGVATSNLRAILSRGPGALATRAKWRRRLGLGDCALGGGGTQRSLGAVALRCARLNVYGFSAGRAGLFLAATLILDLSPRRYIGTMRAIFVARRSVVLGPCFAVVISQTLLVFAAFGQQPEMPAPKTAETASRQTGSPSGAPLSLRDALALARENNPQFQATVTNIGLAREEQTQTRNALLPAVSYENSVIYTQGTPAAAQVAGAGPVVFIANNALHEYVSQVNVHEAIDVRAVASWKRASAAAAVARAQQEIAARGLVVTVVQNFYSLAAAQQKLQAA